MASSISPSIAAAGPITTKQKIVGGVAACALAFAMLRGDIGLAPRGEPANSDKQAKVVQVEAEKTPLPKLDEIRQEMNRTTTKEEWIKRKTDLTIALQKANEVTPSPAKVSALKSFPTDLFWKTVTTPKYFYTGLSIIAGEAVFLGLLWRKMRASTAQWNRRTKASNDSSGKMQTVTNNLSLAEQKLGEVLGRQSEEDRTQLLAALESLPEGNREALKGLLKNGANVAEGEALGAVDVDAAWLNFLGAYEAWQKETVVEARVLSASGPGDFKPGVSLPELITSEEATTKLLSGLDFSWSQVQAFKNQLVHLDDQAKRALGKDLTKKQWVLRFFRNAFLLILVPALPEMILQSYDTHEENVRLAEDGQTATLEDRSLAAKKLIPTLFRPMLWTINEVWRGEPQLASFPCPLSPRSVEEENPDITVLQAIVFQVVLESGQKVEVSKLLDFDFDDAAFEKVFRSVFTLNSGLNGMDAKAKTQIISDMAFKARRIFDEPKPTVFFAPPAVQQTPAAPQPPPAKEEPKAAVAPDFGFKKPEEQK